MKKNILLLVGVLLFIGNTNELFAQELSAEEMYWKATTCFAADDYECAELWMKKSAVLGYDEAKIDLNIWKQVKSDNKLGKLTFLELKYFESMSRSDIKDYSSGKEMFKRAESCYELSKVGVFKSLNLIFAIRFYRISAKKGYKKAQKKLKELGYL